MHRSDTTLVLSPSDLTGHLACRHLTQLERLAAAGELRRPERVDPELEILRARGLEHEAAYLARLHHEGCTVAEIEVPGSDRASLEAAEEATVAAMATGVDVVYQATFFDGRWRGHADFLRRVDVPSARWAWSYEPVDTKLARRVRAAALLQLSDYAAHVARIQGSAPTHVHVVGGDGELHTYRVADLEAYHRRARRSLEAALAGAPSTYPEKVEHCGLCSWRDDCDARRRADDDLALVAGMRASQRAKLTAAGVGTVAALAAIDDDVAVPRMAPHVLHRLRAQAALQLRGRAAGAVLHELAAPADGVGLSLLPAPSPGDLFFDMEGDPFVDGGGLEYLFGVVDVETGTPRFRAFWAHDKRAERRAFEAFVDVVIDALDRHPDMHVYHYAAYERSALRRLMAEHGTREEEVDRILRAEVLVDLYRVVREGVRVSQESYSLKKLEPLYMERRDGEVQDAASSIVAYEQWLQQGDDRLLEEIEAYNRVDCESTWRLREWLEARRRELEAGGDRPLSRPPAGDKAPSEALLAEQADVDAVAHELVAGVPDDPAARSDGERARWLLAQLLSWHRREAKPQWWAWFDRLAKTDDDLLDDAEAVAGLRYEGEVGRVAKSIVHRYRFPTDQEVKLRVGDAPCDPRTRKSAGTIVALDPLRGVLELKRGVANRAPHPDAVVAAPPIDDAILRRSLLRLGTLAVDGGLDALPPAARALLERRAPVVAGRAPGAPLVEPGADVGDAVVELVRGLTGVLPIQGPPGSGKTWTGARVVLDAVRRGLRVGVTATSHKAICNLLEDVCDRARAEGAPVRILQRAPDEERCSRPDVALVDNAEVAAALATGEVDVVAGTAWLFARPELAGTLDLLVVDEAGQFSLANALAVAAAADRLVLLGDPQQLAQPSQGVHPPGADASALGHLLGDAVTVPGASGVLLDVTYRMHPDVCGFVSEAFYEGRLRAAERCAGQALTAGTGLRWVPVKHAGNRTTSPEEVEAVRDVVARLLAATWTAADGSSRPLEPKDVLVVAPCNAHVAALDAALPAGVPVGTVDRFQGQEGVVVVFSMAASSPDDLPRGVDFLYSANRLNVAVSRARALAVLVCSPRLLELRARTPEQIRLVNALCRFVERAEAVAPVPA